MYRVRCLLAAGESLTLTEAQMLSGGFKISDGVSNNGVFEIGCAACGMLEILVNNFSGQYTSSYFTGAVLYPAVGLVLPSGKTEWLEKGIYTVDKTESTGGAIKLTAYDNMLEFDRPYSKSRLPYPATLGEILRDCCTCCGVSLSTQKFLNDDYRVAQRPADEKTNCREIVSYVAQLAGCYARINRGGQLELSWYDLNRFVVEGTIDGNIDTADGNTDSIDGGLFAYPAFEAANLSHIQSLTIAEQDVCITGVQIIPDQEDAPIYLAGTEGYVISIEGNPLVQGREEQLVTALADKLVGFSFRPMQCTALSDPSIEAGDVAWITDRKGRAYRTILSNLTLAARSWESFSADAESPGENQATRYSEASKIVVAAKKQTEQKLTDYDLQVQQLNATMLNAMGTYQTVEKLEDGSTICYAHDQPELENSLKIWKKTADAFAVSIDGGNTWRGMTAEGNIIAQVLSVIGINADWMKVGKITSPANPNIYIDLTNGDAAVNRLTSASTDVYADIGKEEPQYGGAEGLFLYGKNGKYAQVHRMSNKDYPNAPGAQLLTRGMLGILACGGISTDAANAIWMLKDTNGFGTYQFLRARDGSDYTNFLDVNEAQLKLEQHISNDNRGAIYFNQNGGYLESTGKLNFASGGYTKLTINPDQCDIHQSVRMNNWDITGVGNLRAVNIYANGSLVTSDRALKSNVAPVTRSVLNDVKSMRFYSYNFKAYDSTVRMATITGYDDDEGHRAKPPLIETDQREELGLIYDEAPPELQKAIDGNKTIDLYALGCMALKSVQELAEQVQAQSKEIDRLKELIDNGNTNSQGK